VQDCRFALKSARREIVSFRHTRIDVLAGRQRAPCPIRTDFRDDSTEFGTPNQNPHIAVGIAGRTKGKDLRDCPFPGAAAATGWRTSVFLDAQLLLFALANAATVF